jgi:Raf kinase inhibitor-like YbhB/YbcL family protein
VPEPGSHQYDVKRARLRDELDNHGTPDAHATEEANRRLRGPVPRPSGSAETGRAAGPAGARPGPAGDPGNVLMLRSSAFSDNAPMPGRCARDGADEAPSLEWDGVPPDTAELVLLCVDVDAPTGPFVHWLVPGIDPAAASLADADTVAAAAACNGYGERGYGGPLPPIGDEAHRYVFRLYALNQPFDADPEAGAEALRAWLDEHSSAVGTLTGLYQR